MIVSRGRRARHQRPAKRLKIPVSVIAPDRIVALHVHQHQPNFRQEESGSSSIHVPGNTPLQGFLADNSHSRIRLQLLKRFPTNSTMFKQLTMLMLVLVLDPASALVASPTFQLRSATGPQLELESVNSSTNATNPLYEYNTNIKGCKGIQYFFFWSCCGWNSC